jgi:hypothetical protein
MARMICLPSTPPSGSPNFLVKVLEKSQRGVFFAVFVSIQCPTSRVPLVSTAAVTLIKKTKWLPLYEEPAV